MPKPFLYILILIIIANVFTPLEPQRVEAADCTIISADWKPSGEQKDGYFKEGKTEADIVVKTKDCVNTQGLTFTVYESDIANNDDLVNSGLANLKINPPSDTFIIRILLGEESCDSQGSAALFGFDCDLFFKIKQSTTTLYNSKDHGTSGALYYECDGICNVNAKLRGLLPQGPNGAVTSVDPQKTLTTSDETYTLLAPIGSMKEITTKGGTCPGNPDLQSGLGCYLNIFFTLAIGICGVLAVIIIIISGIQYMGDESVFGKTEAKSKIMSAILGLLIALGSYALLRTINPALTGENGVKVETVEGKIERTSGGGELGVEVGTPRAGNPNATKNVTTYDSYLKLASQKYGVQCTLIKAFMYAESGGVNGQTSSAGAKGLIQLMPTTFKEQGYDISNVMDPQTNIMAGASYLSKLKKAGCNGKPSSPVCNISNTQFLAASYNGGPGANKESISCPGKAVWQCTAVRNDYAETRVYAPRVEANFNKLTAKGWGC